MNELITSDIPRVPLSSGNRPAAIVPHDFDGVWRISQVILASGMAPWNFNTVEKVAVAIMHGLEVGLPPMAALQSIAIINGRPSIWGDGALGLVQGSGLLEDIDEILSGDGDAMKATCIAKRVGQKPIIRSFSVDDAKRADLWDTREQVKRKGKDGQWYDAKNDSTWHRYPKRMLAMRARGWALRDGFADVLKGLHIAEEAQDIPARELRDVTPPAAPSGVLTVIRETRQDAKAAGQSAEARQGEAPTVPDRKAPSPQQDVRKPRADSPTAAHQRDPAEAASPDPSTIDENPPSPTAAKKAEAKATADPDPAETFKEAEADFAAATDTARLVALWDYKYQPLADVMFPPDAEELMGIYRKHEGRLSP